MAAAYVHGPATILKLKTISQFEVKAEQGSTEWFQLHSRALSDKQLFAMLKAIWPAIVGADSRKFALIHCLAGPNAGVWFHLLPNDEYEPGCHEVQAF
jgi:hypothetical protein